MAAATAICVIMLAVGLALDAGGLGEAANLVQVLSVASLVGTLAAWGLAKRNSSGRMVSRQVRLAVLLRSIADAHDKSGGELQEVLAGWDVDAFLDGTQYPSWDFVAAFMDVITGGDQDLREGLEHLIRPVWEAARDHAPNGDNGAVGATVLMQVTAETDIWMTVNHRAAEASQAAGRLQETAAELKSWRAGLVFTLGKYASAIRTLTTERDKLASELAAQQDSARQRESGHARQLGVIASELRDVRARLVRAEQQREQISERLAGTERKLRVAEDLRQEALAQASRFRHQLATLEHRPTLDSPADVPLAAIAPYRLMADTDQRLGEEVVRQTDDFLREKDTALSQDAATLARLHKAVTGSRYLRKSIREAASQSEETQPTKSASGEHNRAAVWPVFTGPRSLAVVMMVAISGGAVVLIPLLTASPGAKGVKGAHRPSTVVSPQVTQTPRWPQVTQTPTTVKPHRSLPPPVRPETTLADPGGIWVEGVVFSPDGDTLATADQNGGTYLWDVSTGHRITTFADPSIRVVYGVAFSPDGTVLATADINGSAYLWDVSTGRRITTFTDPGGSGVTHVAFSPDGTVLATADINGSAYLWDVSTGRRITTFADPGSSGVYSVAFSPDGSMLATADYSGSAYLWDVSTGRRITTFTDPHPGLNGINNMAFSPNGGTLATADSNGSAYLWDVSTGRRITTLADPGGTDVGDVAFSPDSGTLATADINGSAYLWDVSTGRRITTFVNPGRDGVNNVAFSPDGSTLAIANGHGGSTCLWNMNWLTS
jgi:WD40 repeat protein